MNAYVSSIEPHTNFFSPRATENFKIRMSLSLEGIGAVLQVDGEYTLVHRVIPGGPADLGQNLHSGDRITGVAQGEEGQPVVDVIGWRLDDVVDLIRGPKGSVVRLQILPTNQPPGGIEHIISIRRDTIRLEEQAAQKATLDTETVNGVFHVGVITIPTFYIDFNAKAKGENDYRSTTRDVLRLLSQLNEENIDGLIVDLRGNGGGALTEAISVTGLFIEAGPIVQVRDSKGKVSIRKDPDPRISYSGPLVVLVDRDSASASEIFAGAIQDYGRGLIVGEPTFGKGTVQNLVDLDRYAKGDLGSLGQLKLTIAQFFRVNGDSTQHRGVVPDFLLPSVDHHENYGERTLENALPWSQIKAARYRPFSGIVRGQRMPHVYLRHTERVDSDPKFRFLIETARLDLANARQKSVSLLESHRRAARARQESRYQQLQTEYHEAVGLIDNPEKANEAAEQTILTEAGFILADMVIGSAIPRN